MTHSADSLRSNWRKVSSTENLQAFEGDGQGLSRGTAGSRATGVFMLSLSLVLVLAQLAVLVAKLGSSPSSKLPQVLQADSYYVYLVPLMVPMVVVGVTVNWFSLKLFKHNS